MLEGKQAEKFNKIAEGNSKLKGSIDFSKEMSVCKKIIEKSNKEKFLELVTEDDVQALKDLNWRIANRDWIKEAKRIAYRVNHFLVENNWTTEKFAKEMKIKKVAAEGIRRGNLNLKLSTIVKIKNLIKINFK